VYVPENVSPAMVPFKLDVALPVAFPAASRVIIPADTLGPTPITVPLLLNPYVPAARASEQRACADAATLSPKVANTTSSDAGAMLRIMASSSNRGFTRLATAKS
jgi:hypothetical protein